MALAIPEREVRVAANDPVEDAEPKDRVIPDLVLAPRRSFQDELEWHDPAPVLLAAEVTARTTVRVDRVKKLAGYARAAIPVYLLIDREAGAVWIYSEPEGGKYTRATRAELSKPIVLPEPFDFELDTSEF
ncbi:Uma2 family endonuclease [Streptomyces boninensis]|uniref:Uma2 family endonuclease n=1 Tax=Streptomyces boninensis TaxID=2039455 RepID=UPI003B220729